VHGWKFRVDEIRLPDTNEWGRFMELDSEPISSSFWRSIPILRALMQPASTVTLRLPHHRFLSAPRPIHPFAAEDWELAWLAAVAYGKTPAGEKRRARSVDAEDSADPEGPLARAGWKVWNDFPDDTLHQQIAATHLRVEVWEKRHAALVAVTFGGTVFDNKMDWLANLRWFLPGKRDQYTDVVKTFAPAFIEEFARRFKDGKDERGQATMLLSTGHSLGGGLAQQFAYCLPRDARVPRVSKVYAFDPSPVTGFFSVDRVLRESNSLPLKIDRIYERGEILAIVRSITSFFWRPRSEHPVIRGIRYNLFFAWNAILGHSIIKMAVKLDAVANSAPLGSPLSEKCG